MPLMPTWSTDEVQADQLGRDTLVQTGRKAGRGSGSWDLSTWEMEAKAQRYKAIFDYSGSHPVGHDLLGGGVSMTLLQGLPNTTRKQIFTLQFEIVAKPL